MLKIVHINYSDFGGAAIAAARLHKGMLASGVQSKFLTYVKTRNDYPEHYLINEITCSQFPLLTKFKLFCKRVLKKLRIIRDFEQKHLKNRPQGFELFTFPFTDFDITQHPYVKAADIVHLHWVARGLLDHELFFKHTNKKVVWTLHDMNPFTGGCHHSDGHSGFEKECFPCPQLKNTIDETLAKKVLALKVKALKSFPKNNLIVVAPSQWLQHLAIKSLVFKGFHIHQIPNGTDSAVFNLTSKQEARKILQLPSDAKILLFTSLDIDNPRKGMRELINAIKNLNQNNVIICTLGNTRTNNFPNAIAMGYIKEEKKLALVYAAADVFVLPSLAENFPNSICESLLCGTPVIAYHTGGIPEQVNEQNGMMVSVGAIKELSTAIESVLNNSEKYIAEHIHQDAKAKYATEIVVDQYKKLYLELINIVV